MSSPDPVIQTLTTAFNGSDDATPLASLADDARRQLNICNACRYCEGLCPVFPALERRTLLSDGDVTQLANLCHDCRACLDACMYSPPHGFGVDLPKALTAERLVDYERFVWPHRVPAALRGRTGLVFGSAISVTIVLAISVLHAGWSGLTDRVAGAASPYDLIPYGALLALMLTASAYAGIVTLLAGRAFWIEINQDGVLVGWRAVFSAVRQAATLAQMRGGGADCYYPESDRPSPRRRRLHHMVSYGFGLCLVSTIAAAVSQDILGSRPPYPWLSVPVISGTLGGVSMLIGCTGLVALKTTGKSATVLAAMTIKDYGLLCALMLLAGSGLAVLLTRETHAYGIVLIVHLSALVECFALAPYSKIIHVVFRFLSLVRDNAELRGMSN